MAARANTPANADSDAKPKRSRKGRHPGRAAFPAHLERVEVLNPVPRASETGAMSCWTNAPWVTLFYSPSADSESVRRFLGEIDIPEASLGTTTTC